MNKQRFNYLNKFQQMNQNDNENDEDDHYYQDVNQLTSSKIHIEQFHQQNIEKFQNFGTFNVQNYQNQTVAQQFSSIKPSVEQISQRCFSTQNPSRISQQLYEHKEITDLNGSDIEIKEQILMKKRKSILEGFSRLHHNKDQKQSVEQENNKMQIETYTQNDLSRLTEKKSYLINQNPQQAQKSYKSSLIHQNDQLNNVQNTIYYNQRSQNKISTSNINPVASIQQRQSRYEKHCKSSGSPGSRKFDSNNTSSYVSNSEQHLQLMKNFIETKSQQVKDLQTFLVKEFQQIQCQKEKYKKFGAIMDQLMQKNEQFKNNFKIQRKIIVQEFQDLKNLALSNIQQVIKRYTKQIMRLKRENQQKNEIIDQQQSKIHDLQTKLKEQQIMIDNLKRTNMLKEEKLQKVIGSIQKKSIEQIEQNHQLQISPHKLDKSKSTKKNRYDYFKHFQNQMIQQGFDPKSTQIDLDLSRKRKNNSPTKIQDDYDNRLQRLLDQVEERQSLIKNKVHNKSNVNLINYNKNYLQQQQQKCVSPLKQSNLDYYQNKKRVSPPRSPSKFSPVKNRSSINMNINNIDYSRSYNRRQENLLPSEVKQSLVDRKKYIKDKIERIKSIKQNQKNDLFRYEEKNIKNHNNIGVLKTPTRIKKELELSPSKNQTIHIKSTYIGQDYVYENADVELQHSYSRPTLPSGLSISKPKLKHSNVGYQYPDRSLKKISLIQDDHVDKSNHNKAASNVYLMGMSTKKAGRY